jgi:hypothetical protein
MCKGISKQKITDSQLGWMQKNDQIQRSSFTGMPHFDTNFEINKDSTPINTFQILFDNEINVQNNHSQRNQ